jgi:putative transposase
LCYIRKVLTSIVIGKNEGFKENIELKKKDKQAFVGIPYAQFIQFLSYKAESYGIKMLLTEESYTSKASFVDMDKLPDYRMKDMDFCIFSGKRIKRGLYRTGNGIFINVDCNGYGNIIRKVFPDAFQGRGDRGVVGTPKVLSIA